MFNDLVLLHTFLKLAQAQPKPGAMVQQNAAINRNKGAIGGAAAPLSMTAKPPAINQANAASSGLPSLSQSAIGMMRRAQLMHELARPIDVQNQRQDQLRNAWQNYNRAVMNIINPQR